MIKSYTTGIFLASLLLIFFSCGPGNQEPTTSSTVPSVPPDVTEPVNFLQNLSPEELQLIRNINEKGGLVTAVTSRADFTQGGEEQAITAFNPELFRAVAQLLGINFTMKRVPFIDVVGLDGEIPPRVLTDPLFSYTPSAFGEIDLALTSLTPLPWRMKLLRYIPIIPNQSVIIVRKEDSQANLEELKTFEFLIAKNTSYVEQHLEFIGDHPQAREPLYVKTDSSVLGLLNDGTGRATLVDGTEFFPHFHRYPNLVAVHGVSALHYVGWVTSKDNPELAVLISKAVSHLFDIKVYHRIFLEIFGLDYIRFSQSIGLTQGQQIHEISFSLDESIAIDELRSTGKFSAAIFNVPESYQIGEDGRNLGFDYNMVIELASFLGLEPDIRLIDSIDEYWKYNGIYNPQVITDTSIAYTPDLFTDVQLYAASFGVNEWRSRLVNFIHLYPAGLAIIGKEADQIKDFFDLDGKRVAVTEGGFQIQLLRSLEQTYGFSATLVLVSQEDEEVFEAISQGRADVTIDGSLFIAQGMQSMQGLTVSPLKLSVVPVGWAVSKNNPSLQSVITKFVNLTLATQSFHRYWSESFGVPFDFYLQLINE